MTGQFSGLRVVIPLAWQATTSGNSCYKSRTWNKYAVAATPETGKRYGAPNPDENERIPVESFYKYVRTTQVIAN